jgi:hypothetical protein
MKQLLTLIIGLFWTSVLYADCAGLGLSVFPTGRTIKQNSIFIINGYAESQRVILGLNKKYHIYLKAGSQRIKLLATKTCVGQFYLTQAILKPETELKAGLEYTMVIENLPEYESLNRYNNTTREHEPVKYKVVAEKDTEKPVVIFKPKEIRKTLVHYGCGPSIHVIFKHETKDSSEVIVKTTVKNLTTGKDVTYYIEQADNKIKVGHGMCSGAFDFDKGNNYEVEFSFVDASGNFTMWTGERIKFSKPTKETNHSEEQ